MKNLKSNPTMKKYFFLLIFCLLGFYKSNAQSNPQMDRPIQQCISNNADKISLLKNDFSIGHWLGKMIETCDRLQSTSGKAGGPQVVALLGMEKELDDLIAIADDCEDLKKVKETLLEMKKIYTEKEKVENFKINNQEDNNGNLFEDDKEITTFSLSRPAAGKIKSKAEKIKKALKK
jgi:hypothetical protein